MIVKNEASIIERFLTAVSPYIDCYCICDTGSTDNTMEIIQSFFQERDIPGKMIEEPFQDFGYNRSVSLKACMEMEEVDYILLLDADMVFHIESRIPIDKFKHHLCSADAFYILQGTEYFHYKNIRIVKNVPDLHYWGVTHEYIVLSKSTSYSELPKNQVFIQDIGDGGSKDDKYPRDIALLKKGLETHPNNSRYIFYLANSYRNNNQPDEAIETYYRCIQSNGWIEEKWYSYYCIGNCYYKMNNIPLAIFNWMEACEIMPNRIENIYRLVHHYRIQSKYQIAHHFYCMAKQMLKQNPHPNYLFMENDVYSYKLDYEFSIIASYCKNDGAKISMSLLNYTALPDEIKRNIISNYKFYTCQLKDIENENHRNLLNCFSSCIQDIDGFQSSTPGICKISDKEYVLNIRYVNYQIDKEGKYSNPTQIITKNRLFHIYWETSWKKEYHKDMDVEYDTTIDNYYIGLEDIRLYLSDDKILYSCNRGNLKNHIQVEIGQIDFKLNKTHHSQILSYDERPRNVEKNWVFCPVEQGDPLIVYSWNPLILGKTENNKFIATHTISAPSPLFQHIRGSCHGILIGNEIWFLCHIVSIELRRYYYHCFIVLDSHTYAYKKHTRLFTFEKEPIEYSVGCIYEKNNDFLIGYSTLDRTTQFISVSKSYFDSENVMMKSM